MTDSTIFPHKCIVSECNVIVQFDDEPWCFVHSPDEGSSLSGYSARDAAKNPGEEVKHNVFEQNENL